MWWIALAVSSKIQLLYVPSKAVCHLVSAAEYCCLELEALRTCPANGPSNSLGQLSSGTKLASKSRIAFSQSLRDLWSASFNGLGYLLQLQDTRKLSAPVAPAAGELPIEQVECYAGIPTVAVRQVLMEPTHRSFTIQSHSTDRIFLRPCHLFLRFWLSSPSLRNRRSIISG